MGEREDLWCLCFLYNGKEGFLNLNLSNGRIMNLKCYNIYFLDGDWNVTGECVRLW